MTWQDVEMIRDFFAPLCRRKSRRVEALFQLTQLCVDIAKPR